MKSLEEEKIITSIILALDWLKSKEKMKFES